MPRERLPLLALAALALASGLWAALVRIGWGLPALPLPIAGQHGALMISGFLGTLISLERAVALNWRPAFLPPLFSGLGMVWLIFGLPMEVGRALITLGALGLTLVFIRIIRLQMATFTIVMGLGAVCWLIGDLVWLARWPLLNTLPWWVGFLVLTIAGERLELGRLLRLGKWEQSGFIFSVGVLLAGLLLSLVSLLHGWALAGLGFVLLGLWLLQFDIARRTVRQTGLPRYIAVCLLIGYGWLILGGGLWIAFGTLPASNLLYDAALHAVLLGFVFSMIFGHAPIILPALFNRLVTYTPAFYLPLTALHLSLILRLTGDLGGWPAGRLWGGLFNVLAVLVFFPLVFITLRRAAPSTPPPAKPAR